MIGREFAIEEATIASVQAAYVNGQLTCQALVETYLARIATIDGGKSGLNAILSVNPDAMRRAEQLDADFSADPSAVGPLHGVPVILKDNFDTFDMATTGGSRVFAGAVPARDAFVVARMREAGAIILAKANLTEFAMGGTTVSSLGGQTRNPYDLFRTPGGSSGGTGAAIAANLGLVGTGSDTGQSTRSPASANCLVGLRSTRGLVSRSGIMPLSFTQDNVGPLTRTVADAARLLDVWAGHFDPDDPVTAFGTGRPPETYLASPGTQGLDGRRIGLLWDLVGTRSIHEPVNAVLDRAVADFRALGATVVGITIPRIRDLIAGTNTSVHEAAPAMAAYLQRFGAQAPFSSLAEIGATGLVHPDLKEVFEKRTCLIAPLDDLQYQVAFRKRDVLRQELMAVMAGNRLDALCYPHQMRLVAAIGEPQLERNGVLANATGFPALAFPGGFSSPTDTAPIGVPVGIELLGMEYAEPILLDMAHAFERATRHRRPPTLCQNGIRAPVMRTVTSANSVEPDRQLP